MKKYLMPSLIHTACMVVVIGLYTLSVYGIGKLMPNGGDAPHTI